MNDERFIAIPVGAGDAFFLEKNGKNILFDGGKAKKEFYNIFTSQIPKLENIDIMVCSHADADHINGLIGLLKNPQGIKIKELWVPGRWSNRLLDLRNNPSKFKDEIIDDINKLQRDISDLESVSEQLDNINITSEETIREDFKPSLKKNNICDTRYSYECKILLRRYPKLNKKRCTLYLEAICIAEKIKTLVELASDLGTKIRWFDFSKFKNNGSTPSGGITNLLIPVNSVELKSPKELKTISALKYLSLTVSNKESLVFLAPETKDNPSVLFTADSDLNFNLNLSPRVTKSMIVTAPHHGSEANSNAYNKLANIKVDKYWIRSDGEYQERPGKSFCNQTYRDCTICPKSSKNKVAVIYKNNNGNWQRTSNTSCACCIKR